MNFPPVDLCFLIIMFVFGFMAMSKGFIGELFGKAAVIGGLGLAIVFTPMLEFYVKKTIANSIVSKVLSFLLIFIVVFLLVSIIRHFVGKAFDGDIMKGLDKSLGFAFGLAEGLVVVCFVMIIVELFKPVYDLSFIFEGSIFFRFLSGLALFSVNHLKGSI